MDVTGLRAFITEEKETISSGFQHGWHEQFVSIEVSLRLDAFRRDFSQAVKFGGHDLNSRELGHISLVLVLNSVPDTKFSVALSSRPGKIKK
jgi:hypothetical protein